MPRSCILITASRAVRKCWCLAMSVIYGQTAYAPYGFHIRYFRHRRRKGGAQGSYPRCSWVLEKTNGVTLRLLAWPDSFRPGLGGDPQLVVNGQVSDEYDIYIGILGSRFGHPTPRAGSGTEEEFDEAVARFQRDPTSVRVLFYFKRSAEDPFTIDLTQVQCVRRFRDDLTANGVLYRDFTDTAAFAAMIRNHLQHLILDEWTGQCWREPSIEENRAALNSATPLATDAEPRARHLQETPKHETALREDDDEALGLIELMQEVEHSASDLTAVLARICVHTEGIGRSRACKRRADSTNVCSAIEGRCRSGSNRSA